MPSFRLFSSILTTHDSSGVVSCCCSVSSASNNAAQDTSRLPCCQWMKLGRLILYPLLIGGEPLSLRLHPVDVRAVVDADCPDVASGCRPGYGDRQITMSVLCPPQRFEMWAGLKNHTIKNILFNNKGVIWFTRKKYIPGNIWDWKATCVECWTISQSHSYLNLLKGEVRPIKRHAHSVSITNFLYTHCEVSDPHNQPHMPRMGFMVMV